MARANPATCPPAEEPLGTSGFPRRIGCVGPPGGPALICVGGLHGNEPPGVLALHRILSCLEADPRGLRGRLVGLAGNRQALAEAERFLDEDLNRIWTRERIDRVRTYADPEIAEERELAELADALDAELDESPDAWVLDLHSMSGDGPPFINFDDSLSNRVFAAALPVPRVLGLEEELAGTLLGHLNSRGFTGIGFEAGQHLDAGSVDRAEAAVWIAMEACGVIERGERAEVDEARRLLEREGGASAGVVEVRYRHPVASGDGFRMLPGYRSFQRTRKGEVLAHDSKGPITAGEDGMILMPLYQDRGDDGFFLIRRVNRIWLILSAWFRRLRVDRIVHWLPGVRRHPELPGAFLVDRTRARWLALQVFHLLGFRRRSTEGSILEMVRRERS